ncbi:MAG: hypothetical protein JSR99_12215 [Proteobacteria bacterium]|nr:hypothetical protein [Pseudomonadota bacterium]
MAQDLESVVSALDRETAAYEVKRGELERALAGLVPDPSDAVGDLLSWSEEFGREHAIELFQNDLHTYPADPEITDELWPQRLMDVSQRIDGLLNAQDRLDELTRERELIQGRAPVDGRRQVNFQGQECELDAAALEVRDRDGQTYAISEQATLTQLNAREVGGEPQQPDHSAPSRDRTRSR